MSNPQNMSYRIRGNHYKVKIMR